MALTKALKHKGKSIDRLLASCLLLLCALPVLAFEQLSPAQALIYDTGHLGNTHVGDVITYHYAYKDSTDEEVNDVATLTIAKALPEGRRDVELDFLTDSRHLALPAFPGYRGNPIIIAMFEHIAQTMGAATGGGTLYFRNRIRDALAEQSLLVETGKTEFADQEIETSSLSFSPFTNDTYLDKSSILRNALFTVQFSDKVPAGVVEVAVSARSDAEQFSRVLTLQ